MSRLDVLQKARWSRLQLILAEVVWIQSFRGSKGWECVRVCRFKEYNVHCLVERMFLKVALPLLGSQLREEFDRGIDVQLDEEHSVHDVAALLKEFLRDMPDPLLTRELYTAFINTTCEPQLSATFWLPYCFQLKNYKNKSNL